MARVSGWQVAVRARIETVRVLGMLEFASIFVLLIPHVLLAQDGAPSPEEVERFSERARDERQAGRQVSVPNQIFSEVVHEAPEDFSGPYYADLGHEGAEFAALVISPDGRAIPPKINDPEAPTEPGLYIGEQRFPFARSHLASSGFSFRTVRVGNAEYSFRGRFGREQVDVIPAVPYLAGILTEMRGGRIVLRKKVHFAHAVVL
jgi:hypothetical protein